MGICAVCEKEFDNSGLRQVISKRGIIKVCGNCRNEDMLLLNRPDPEVFEDIYSRGSVHSRLSESAGLRKIETDKKRISEFGKNSGVVRDEHLKRIANKNYEDYAKKLPPNKDLVDNFHWIIMRARRFKKISQKKLAEDLQESESAIDMAERGIIPEGNEFLVRKIEQYLGVAISKKTLENRRNPTNEDLVKKQLIDKFLEENEFDVLTKKNLTLSDLNELSDKGKKKRKWWQFGKKEEFEEEKDLGEEDEEMPKNPFFKAPGN